MRSADAVVVGAGAFGASVTYHLTTMGLRVAMVDQFDAVSQTTSRGAGQTQKVRHDALTSRLATRSVDMIVDFARAQPGSLAYNQVGSVKIARNRRSETQIHAEGRQLGIDIALVDHVEARRIAPHVNFDHASAISFTPSDLYLEAVELPRHYITAARARGATVMTNTEVTGIHLTSGRVSAVATSRGLISTPVVVNAAGAWAPRIGKMVSVDIPVVAVRHQLLITAPLPNIHPELPIVRVLDTPGYFRPAANGGLMVSGFERSPAVVDDDDLRHGVEGLDPDLERLRPIMEDMQLELPALRTAVVDDVRVGLPTMTVDGKHIIGPVPGVQNYFVIAGCNSGGLSVSPAVGEAVARWIEAGHPPIDLTDYRITRFPPDLSDPTLLRRLCLERYAHHYRPPHSMAQQQ